MKTIKRWVRSWLRERAIPLMRFGSCGLPTPVGAQLTFPILTAHVVREVDGVVIYLVGFSDQIVLNEGDRLAFEVEPNGALSLYRE